MYLFLLEIFVFLYHFKLMSGILSFNLKAPSSIHISSFVVWTP
jgi:hypothetical protein